jgi:predicted AAA+ superfamily ATPase
VIANNTFVGRLDLGRDILQLFPALNRQKYQLFLQMLSNLSGTIINYSQIARALGVSQPTAREYFHIAHGTFIWRHIPPYEKNPTKRVVKHPKGYMRDSGLLHFLLHLNSLDDLLTHPQMGHSWESMVVENLLRGLNAQGIAYEYYHYRTGAEQKSISSWKENSVWYLLRSNTDRKFP